MTTETTTTDTGQSATAIAPLTQEYPVPAPRVHVPRRQKCIARMRNCRKCEYDYPKEDKELWACPQCGEDRHCKHYAVTGYNVCREHGAGSVHKGRRGGRPPSNYLYSRQMPESIRLRYEQAVGDPELLALKPQVALVDARIGETVEGLDTTSMIDLPRLRALLRELRSGAEDPDTTLTEMEALTSKWETGLAAWKHLLELFEQRRKLVSTETRRLVDLRQVLTVEEAMALVGRIRFILNKNLVVGTTITPEMLTEIRLQLLEAQETGPVPVRRTPASATAES